MVPTARTSLQLQDLAPILSLGVRVRSQALHLADNFEAPIGEAEGTAKAMTMATTMKAEIPSGRR